MTSEKANKNWRTSIRDGQKLTTTNLVVVSDYYLWDYCGICPLLELCNFETKIGPRWANKLCAL